MQYKLGLPCKVEAGPRYPARGGGLNQEVYSTGNRKDMFFSEQSWVFRYHQVEQDGTHC